MRDERAVLEGVVANVRAQEYRDRPDYDDPLETICAENGACCEVVVER